jgi:hypothetical protein
MSTTSPWSPAGACTHFFVYEYTNPFHPLTHLQPNRSPPQKTKPYSVLEYGLAQHADAFLSEPDYILALLDVLLQLHYDQAYRGLCDRWVGF